MGRKYFVLIVLFSVVFLGLNPSGVFAKGGPVGPNKLQAEAGPGPNQITLYWQRVNPDLTNYNILYGTAPAKYQYGVGRIGNTATYTIGALQAGQRYYFRLYPYRNEVLSDPASPEVSEIALSYPHVVSGTPGPFGQRDLVATAGPGRGQVTLTWHKLLNDVTNYHIIYGIKPGVYIYAALNIGKTFNYTINDLTPGVRYYFAVTPIRGDISIYDSAFVSQVAPQ